LPPVDHATLKYEEIEKNFYDESEEIAAMAENEVIAFRRGLGSLLGPLVFLFLLHSS